jgi:hypothetical protein
MQLLDLLPNRGGLSFGLIASRSLRLELLLPPDSTLVRGRLGIGSVFKSAL